MSRGRPSRTNTRKPSSTINVELVDGDMLVSPLGDYARLRPDALVKRQPSSRRVSVADLKAAS